MSCRLGRGIPPLLGLQDAALPVHISSPKPSWSEKLQPNFWELQRDIRRGETHRLANCIHCARLILRIVKDPCVLHEQWVAEYGKTLKYHGFLGVGVNCCSYASALTCRQNYRFFTMDTTAIHFILSHADEFPKPDTARTALKNILGDGTLPCSV